MVGDLEPKFAGGIEREDTGERGIRDIKDALAFRDGDRRSETDASELVPTLPFHFRAIVEAHAICAGIGQAEVVIFVEGEAERFGESFIAFFGTGKPMAEPRESGLFNAEVGGAGEALDVGDARRIRRRRPDQSG